MSSVLPYRYIAVEGNIGAGKTSLARILANRFNGDLVLEEFADNTFLPQFYLQPERFAFPLEMSFLAERYQQLSQQQITSASENKLLISDYIFEKSLLFAKVNLKGNELDLFRRFYEMIQPSLKKPDLIIYLHKSTPSLLDNIGKRGREYEQSIPHTYLDDITHEYLMHFESRKQDNILRIESDKLDFINDITHLQLLLKLITAEHDNGMRSIDPLTTA